MLCWKHSGLHVSTPTLPSSPIFPLPAFKQVRWNKKLCAADFQVTTVGHGKWIDIAHSTTKANSAHPCWAAECAWHRTARGDKWLCPSAWPGVWLTLHGPNIYPEPARVVDAVVEEDWRILRNILVLKRLLETPKKWWSAAQPGKGILHFPEGGWNDVGLVSSPG